MGKRSIAALVLWILAGAILPLGLLAAFTPLILLTTPLAAVLVVAAVRLAGTGPWAWALAGGLAVPLTLVGWLNRHGPGSYCHVSGTATNCTDLWNPLPWYGLAAVLVAVGVAGVVLGLRTQRRSGAAG